MATFWPGMKYGSVDLVKVDAGTEIVGPDGKVLRVSKGRAVCRGDRIYVVSSDYEELKQRIPSSTAGRPRAL